MRRILRHLELAIVVSRCQHNHLQDRVRIPPHPLVQYCKESYSSGKTWFSVFPCDALRADTAPDSAPLLCLGAESGLVLRIFLTKALLLGLVGGIGGFVIGTTLAVTLGPKLTGVPVLPMPVLALWAVGISAEITLLASYFPARRAARLDPVATFQEV